MLFPEIHASELEKALGNPRTLDLLGRPASPYLVRRGLHPITPDRVAVMTDEEGTQDRDYPAEARPLEGRLNVPAAKLDLIFRMVRRMTSYYGASDLLWPWAKGLAAREALAPTGLGHGFGLLHQFQDDRPVQLCNAPVDWWLFLFPEGVDWGAFDGEPVFGMIGHVFSPHHDNLAALKLRVYEFTSRIGREVASGRETAHAGLRLLAGMDPVIASQTVNQAVARCLARN